MIEISGYSNVKINVIVSDAIDAIYKESIAVDKDKTKPGSAEIFTAIEFLINYFCDVTNLLGKSELNIVEIDGISSSQDYLNASDSKFYIEGINAINALYKRFNEFHEIKIINNEKYDCYDKYLEKPDREYRRKANKVKSSLEYLIKRYPYFVNGTSLEEEIYSDLEDYENTVNYALTRAKFFYQKEKIDIENAKTNPSLYSIKKPIFRFKSKRKDVEKIENFWETLCTPMHASLKHIKAAFIAQIEIAKLRMLNAQNIDNTYIKRLVDLNSALAILSDPYLKYVHYCKIKSEKAMYYDEYMANIKKTADELENSNYFQEENNEENDFGPKGNEKFLEFIAGLIEEFYNIKLSNYNELDKKLYEELINSLKYNYDELSKKIGKQKEAVLSLGCK